MGADAQVGKETQHAPQERVHDRLEAILAADVAGYGLPPSETGPEFTRRLMAYALLHRYSNLRWYLERIPPPANAITLDELADAWFSCAAPAS